MPPNVEDSTERLLRATPDPIVSLAWIRERLSEAGDVAGATTAHIESRLRRRPDLFLVLEQRQPIGAADWPADVRQAYESALHRAGVDTSPRVLLLGEDSDADALEPYRPGSEVANAVTTQLRSGLAALCRNFVDDPTARQDLLHAADCVRAIAAIVAEHESRPSGAPVIGGG